MKSVVIIFSKNKFLVVFILLIGLLFYWYSYRPVHVKEKCSAEANFNAKGREVGFDYLENQRIYDIAYNSAYKECLNNNGY